MWVQTWLCVCVIIVNDDTALPQKIHGRALIVEVDVPTVLRTSKR